MEIDRIDHVVLTARDLDATVAFYCGVLGMRLERFGEGRLALAFGGQKINLHRLGDEIAPKAAVPTPGSLDLCLIVRTPLAEVARVLAAAGVALGPVRRTGASGPITSLYLRDPDSNLIELAAYD